MNLRYGVLWDLRLAAVLTQLTHHDHDSYGLHWVASALGGSVVTDNVFKFP